MGIANRVKRVVRKARVMKKVKYLQNPDVLRAGADLKAVSKTHLLTARRYAERLKFFEKMAKTHSPGQERNYALRQIKEMKDMVRGNKEWATAARFIHTENAKKAK